MEKQTRRNRVLCGVFAALFFAFLVLPAPLWALARGHVDTENRENRELAAFPAPGQVPLEEWPGAFEAWLADHAPFRNQWMTTNAALNWRVFGTIESDIVLQGGDGWMFYKNADDARPLDDYQGINPYTEAQMAEIAANLTALQTALAAHGTELTVLIPPSKELVYRQHMPQSIPMVAPQGRIDVLAAYLGGNCEVPFVWPEAELRAAGEAQQLYYRYDTHWNEAGAALTAAMMLKALGLEGPDPASLAYEPSATPPLRDLANLSATWKLAGPDQSWQAAGWMPGVVVEHTAASEDGFYDAYAAPDAPNAQKLLMFRDSFGEYLRQPLAACFTESAFVHINGFGEDTLREEAPDLFVIEVTQRYADRLLDYLPRLVEWAEAM